VKFFSLPTELQLVFAELHSTKDLAMQLPLNQLSKLHAWDKLPVMFRPKTTFSETHAVEPSKPSPSLFNALAHQDIPALTTQTTIDLSATLLELSFTSEELSLKPKLTMFVNQPVTPPTGEESGNAQLTALQLTTGPHPMLIWEETKLPTEELSSPPDIGPETSNQKPLNTDHGAEMDSVMTEPETPLTVITTSHGTPTRSTMLMELESRKETNCTNLTGGIKTKTQDTTTAGA